jgi:hypothetical protein
MRELSELAEAGFGAVGAETALTASPKEGARIKWYHMTRDGFVRLSGCHVVGPAQVSRQKYLRSQPC